MHQLKGPKSSLGLFALSWEVVFYEVVNLLYFKAILYISVQCAYYWWIVNFEQLKGEKHKMKIPSIIL